MEHILHLQQAIYYFTIINAEVLFYSETTT